jgi:hypothetical protein
MPTAIEIETIVRVVVERLRGLQSAQVIEQSSPQTQLVAHNNTHPQASKTFSLDSRLVTLEHLRGKLNGIEILEVTNRAVVTPAVVDELRDRGVQLQRRQRNSSSEAASPVEQRVLVVASSNTGATPPADASTETIVQAIAEHVGRSRNLAIWSSKHPYAAAIAARAHRSLTAIQLFSVSEIERVLAEAKPNVLILDELQWSSAALGQLARMWSERSL